MYGKLAMVDTDEPRFDTAVTPSSLGFWYRHNRSAQVARRRIRNDTTLFDGKRARLREAGEVLVPPALNQFIGQRYEAQIKWLVAARAGRFVDFEPGGTHAGVFLDHPPSPSDLTAFDGYEPVAEDRRTTTGTQAALAEACTYVRGEDAHTDPVVLWQPPMEGRLGAYPVEKAAADMVVIWPTSHDAVRVRALDLKATKLVPGQEKRAGQVMQTVCYAELIDQLFGSIDVPYELEAGVWTRDSEPEPTADLTPDVLPEIDISLGHLRRQLESDLGPDGVLTAALAADSALDLSLPSPTNTTGALAELYAVHAWDQDSPWSGMKLTGMESDTCQTLADEYGVDSLEAIAGLVPPPDRYVADRDGPPRPWQQPLSWADDTGRRIEEDPTIGTNVRRAALQAQVFLGVIDPDHSHAYVPDFEDIWNRWAWHPGSGAAPLPSTEPTPISNEAAMDDAAIRVYLYVGLDVLHKRPWAVAARVSTGSSPRENVASLVETANDWYRGTGSDEDIEQGLLERASRSVLETIEAVSETRDAYVHFYTFERRERERLLEGLDRHANVALPIDALRHLLSSEAGPDQQMVTELQPIIDTHVALPTTQTSLRHAISYVDPTPNESTNGISKDVPPAPAWEYERDGTSIDLEKTFDQRFFGIFVPATREGHFRPLVDEADFDDNGDLQVSRDAWVSPVPRYGAQLPVEYHHVALDRFDLVPGSSGSRSAIAAATTADLLDESLDKWRGAVPTSATFASKQQLSAQDRRDNLPDVVPADVKAALDAITQDLNRLERDLSWGIANDDVEKAQLPTDSLEQYRVDQNTDPNARPVEGNLLASRYIEQDAKLNEHRSRYAESTTRQVLLDGEAVPIRVAEFDRVEWTIVAGPHGDDIAVPERLRIDCDVVFDDGTLDLLAPGEVAQRCKLTVDDGVGTNPLVLAVPVDQDWEYFDAHWFLKTRGQAAIEQLEIDESGHGDALLDWQWTHPFASSEPFTHSHRNFDTPPSQRESHPDARVEAADDEDRQSISIGDRFLLVKTADDYIGRKIRTRFRERDPGDDPFIDFLERTLGWRDNLVDRLTDALLDIATERGLELEEALDRLANLDGNALVALTRDLQGETRPDEDVLEDYLDRTGADEEASEEGDS